MKDKEMIEICENCKIKDNCSHRILTHMEKCKVNDCDYFQNISTDKENEELTQNKQWQRRDNYCLRIQKALQYKGTSDNEDVPSILVDFEKEIRKEILPEDSVVLSKEEYEKYQNLKRDVEHSFEYNQGYIDGQKKGSKETAEKFYKKVRKLLKKVDIIVDGDEGLVGYEESAVDKGLTEIAKQFGVEIKE